MKFKSLFLLVASIILFSCSKDKENDAVTGEAALIGTWHFAELDVTTAQSPENIELANDVIEVLLENGCEILVFTFKADKTVDVRAKDFTETGVDVKPDGSGLLIECPANTETETSVWALDGDQLTFINSQGLSETITIELSGSSLIIPAEVINEDNLNGAKAIFVKK